MTGQQTQALQPPAVADGLFFDDDLGADTIRLRGGCHRATGRIVFPCPEDGHHDPVALSRTGWLWSFTVQRFRPKSPPYDGPEAFEPYAVGYVELPGQVIVEGRMTGIAFDDLRIGMPVRLATAELADAAGRLRTTFAFTAPEQAA